MTEETLNKRSEAGGNTVRLVHITTVPETFIFLRGQVTYMKDRGFEVIAISSPGPDLAVFSEGEGYRAYPVDMPRRITPLRDLRAVYQTWRLLKRIRPHIVHSHTPKGGLIGMLGARLAGAPVRIYHVRGLPLETAQGMKRRLLSLSERVSCRLAHQVLCVSPSLRKLVTEEFCTCPSEKVKVLGRGSGNGVDAMDRFNPEHLDPDTRREMRRRLGIPEEARVIGYVGRIVRDKGIEELAGAWKSLRENYPDLHLLMAGYLEPEDPVSEEAKELIQTTHGSTSPEK
jgi:glycosyltransferase involved in cell wall biosynthesis